MDFVRVKDEPWIRRPPEYRFIIRIPRKDPLAISRQQTLLTEVAADSQQAFGRGKVGGWKGYVFGEEEYGHGDQCTKLGTGYAVRI
jgi:hypothetical protein